MVKFSIKPAPFTVKIISSDCKIWNEQEVLGDICFAMSQNMDIILCLNSEGPDFGSLGLSGFIESQCERYGYDLRRIFLRTRNMSETYDQITVEKTFPWHLMVTCLDYDRPVIKSPELRHFGMFIGRNNAPRLFLGSYLYTKYKHLTVHTNHFDRDSDWSFANTGLEELVVRYGLDDIQDAAWYLKQCPINVTESHRAQSNTGRPTDHRFQDLLSRDKESFLKNYNNFAVEITCETYFTGETFFPTEKTWRPMLLKTPFLVQGPKHYLKKLRDMGFITFGQWWSESYDEDEAGTAWHEISQIIDDLAAKTTLDMYHMLGDMESVLEHNRQRVLELCAEHPKL